MPQPQRWCTALHMSSGSARCWYAIRFELRCKMSGSQGAVFNINLDVRSSDRPSDSIPAAGTTWTRVRRHGMQPNSVPTVPVTESRLPRRFFYNGTGKREKRGWRAAPHTPTTMSIKTIKVTPYQSRYLLSVASSTFILTFAFGPH